MPSVPPPPVPAQATVPPVTAPAPATTTPAPTTTVPTTPPPVDPKARKGRALAPTAVAPGGLLRIRAKGVAFPARAQQSIDGAWVGRGDPITAGATTTTFRIRESSGRRTFRVVGADGVPTPVTKVRVRPLTLAAVGDINVSPAPLGSISGGDVEAPWRSVGPVLRAADMTFGNLECAISLRGRPFAKQFRFRGSPRALRAAVRLGGFDVLDLANNHSGDFGQTALFDTLANVRRTGASPIGAGANATQAARPAIRTRLGLKVAYVGFNEILPPEFRATSTRPGVAWATPENVRSAVRAAAKDADVVIAAFHWGIELDRKPNGRQVQLAKTALAAGATAVIGAHPHVLQPVVRSGRRVIAYSLGNFVFPANSAGTTRTGILELRLAAGRVVGHRFRPATIRGATPVLR